MIKNIFNLFLFFCLIGFSFAVQAQSIENPYDDSTGFKILKPFVGVEYAKASGDYYSKGQDIYQDNLKNYSVYGGVRLTDFVSVSAFYQMSADATEADTTVNLSAYGADVTLETPTSLLIVLPLNLSLGYGFYDFEAKSKAFPKTMSEKNGGIRFGLGTHYDLTESWKVRATLRLVMVDNDTFADEVFEGLSELAVGVEYNF